MRLPIALLLTVSTALACRDVTFTINSQVGSLGPVTVGFPVPLVIQAMTTGYTGVQDSGGGQPSLTITSNSPSTLGVRGFTTTPAAPPWGQTAPFTITPILIPQAAGQTTGSLLLTPYCGTYAGAPVVYNVSFTGVAATGSILTVANTNQQSASEPVALGTGELFGHDETPDLALGGPLPLVFRRYYASYLSGSGVSSALGSNWMHNFDVKLSVSGSNATVALFRGKTVKFTQAGGVWKLSGSEQRAYQLIAAPGGYQFFAPGSNAFYSFNSSGALTAIQDRNGNTLTVTPGANGPTQISDGLGRALTLTYSGSNLAKVQDQAGRSVSYEYSGGNLTAVTDANGKRQTFTYTSAGGFSGLMTTNTLPLGNQPFSQTFDSQGRVATQTDSFGNSMALSYSTSGTTLTEPLGFSLTSVHDSQLNFTTQSDPSGGTSKYGWDSSGHIVSITDRTGGKVSLGYDAASGLATSSTDAAGNTTTVKYTASTINGLTFYDISSVTAPDGASESFGRDGKGNLVSFTDAAGKVWQFTYNARGQLLTSTNPVGAVTTYTYNSDGTVASLQPPNGDATKYAYDSAKRPITVTLPGGETQSIQYDALDRVVKVTDGRGNATSSVFTDNGRLKSTTNAAGATTSFTYDGDERLTAFSDALGKSTKNTFDALSRLLSTTDPAGVSVTYAYDKTNHLTGFTDAAGKTTTFGKDAEDRLTSVTDPLSRTVTIARDARGLVTSTTTAAGEKFSAAYDAAGRVTAATDPLGRVTRAQYDARGAVSGVTLPGGVAASYTRNELGLVTSAVDPGGNAWTNAFDSSGRRLSTADPLGQKTSFEYDSRGRVSKVTLPEGSVQYGRDTATNATTQTYSDGTKLTFNRDSAGRLSGGTGAAFTYDAAGRMTSSNGLQVGRDDAGRISSITYAAGKVARYTYDNRGLLAQVQDWAGGATSFTYDAARQLTSIAFANGVSQSFAYDVNGRLKSIAVAKGGNSLTSIQVTRDALGRITASQRTAANVPTPAESYMPLAFDAASQSAAATYDGLGRVTGDYQRSYTWDLASRLTSYKGLDGAASFTYDALGGRISRTAGGATQSYILNYATALPTVAVVRSGSADQRYYIWTPGGALLESIDASGGSRRFYHFDEAGSAAALTDDSGAVTDTYAIPPFGESVGHTGSSDNPFTFHGAWGVMQEPGTSIYYDRARYYDAASGRFLSRDAARRNDPMSLNPYQFAFNDPVQFHDPTGRTPNTSWSGVYVGGNGGGWDAGASFRSSTQFGTLGSPWPMRPMEGFGQRLQSPCGPPLLPFRTFVSTLGILPSPVTGLPLSSFSYPRLDPNTPMVSSLTALQTPEGNGTAAAVWEILQTDPNAMDALRFATFYTMASSPVTPQVPIGTGTVSLSFAPVVSPSGARSPIPRFAPMGTSGLNVLNPATVPILFPYALTAGMPPP